MTRGVNTASLDLVFLLFVVFQNIVKTKLHMFPFFFSQIKYNPQDPVDSFFLSARTAEQVPVGATRKVKKNRM